MKTNLFLKQLLFLWVFAFSASLWGQTTIASDGLNNSTGLFAVSGGAYYSGNSGTGDVPKSSPLAAEGTHSYGVTNGLATLTSSSINTSNYDGVSLTFRVAAFSIGSTGNGIDGSDTVIAEISTDGTTFTKMITLSGGTNVTWTYAQGLTGSAIYPTAKVLTAGNGTLGYSTISISNLPKSTTLKVKITLLNNAAAERWVVDDIVVKGTLAVAQPNLSISNAQNHGASCLGISTGAKTYTVTNNGSVAADEVTVNSTDGQFVISNYLTQTIAANGGTATFDVTFTPDKINAQSANISITSTTVNSNSPFIVLSGIGNPSVNGVVSTSIATEVNNSGAKFNGNLSTLGTCPNTTEKGFVWGTNANPTIIVDNAITVAGLATGSYNYNLTGLNDNSSYHYRSYIKDANDNYIYGNDQEFTTLTVANHIALVDLPANGSVNNNLAAFKVEARRADNSVDVSYAGNVVLSKATGTGVMSGTLTQPFTNGIATFNDIKFDAVGKYTIYADHDTFTRITSDNIVITNPPIILTGWDFTGETQLVTSDADTVAENIDNASKVLTRGSGAAASAGGNSFRTVGFKNDGIAVTNTDYFQNVVKAKTGYKVSLSKINVRFNGTSAFYLNPGVTSQYAYSLDGTNFTLIGSPFAVTSTDFTYNIDLLGVAALQNVDANTTIYIRYYASGQTATGGWGYSSSASGKNGLEVLGNVVSTEVSTTWTGTGWSNGNPSVDTAVTINGDYDGAAFEAQSLIVNAGKTLTVNDYIITGKVTNNGNIIVANNANFVQTGDFTPALTGSSFKVNRTTRDVSRLDYISWSSPMQNSVQTLKGFSPQTVDARFLTYNSGVFVKVANPNVPFNRGQGYLIRTPNNFNNFPAVQKFNGVFEGTKPNTGSLSYDPSVIEGAFVFLGNPYPSAISMEAFYDANPQIDGSFYIWDSVAAKMDTNGKYSGSNYVTHTSAGSVPLGSASFVPVAQGFFINRGTSNALLNFNNGMRQTTETGTFAKTSVTDKFWLQMTAPSGAKPQMLIGFNQNATSGYDQGLDAKMLDSNADVIYSTVDAKSLIINAVGSFSSTDVINVTANFLAAGNYTISIAQKKGIFTNGQQIYLKDNVAGVETELSAGDYSFAATAGLQANRFTVYFSRGILANSNVTKGQSTIYADHQVIFVKGASKIVTVQVYDMSGKLMKTTKNVNAESTSLAVAYKGIAVVRLVLNNGEVVTKKVILK